MRKAATEWQECKCAACEHVRNSLLSPTPHPRPENYGTQAVDATALWETIWAKSFCTCGTTAGKQCEMCLTAEEKRSQTSEQLMKKAAVDNLKRQLERLVVREAEGEGEIQRREDTKKGTAAWECGEDYTAKKLKCEVPMHLILLNSGIKYQLFRVPRQ